MCVFGEGIYCSPPRTASPHLECSWNIYRIHRHRDSPLSTLRFKIEGSLSETDCVLSLYVLSAFLHLSTDLLASHLCPSGDAACFLWKFFKIASKGFWRGYHGVVTMVSGFLPFSSSSSHNRGQRSWPLQPTTVWWNKRLTQGAQITLHPCLNWSNLSSAGKHQRGRMIRLWGRSRICPQSPSSSCAALSGAFAEVQLTIDWIPLSEWGTRFAGTWNALRGIHLDSCFWTVPSLLRPSFGTNAHFETKILTQVVTYTAHWLVDSDSVSQLPDYEVNILPACGHLLQICHVMIADCVLFWSWKP